MKFFYLLIIFIVTNSYANPMSIDLLINTNVCKKMTYSTLDGSQSGPVNPGDFYYEIKNYQDFDGSGGRQIYNYYCYTDKNDTTPFTLWAAQGDWQDAEDIRASINFKIDDKYYAPCGINQEDFVYMDDSLGSTTFLHCPQVVSPPDSGATNSSWFVTTGTDGGPGISLPSNWNSIDVTSRTYDKAWWQPHHLVEMYIYHKYIPVPPKPNLDDLMLIVTGYTNDFYLYNESGKNTTQVSSSPSPKWYRVGVPKSDTTLNPSMFYIGMSDDALTKLKDDDYTCTITMTPDSGAENPINVDSDELIFSNASYPQYKFSEVQLSSMRYTPLNNIVTFVTTAKCTSSDSGMPEIDFNPQTLKLYRVEHF